MLIKIAWKNVWRNKLRSAVVILSIAVGLWAGVFSMALFNGLNQQRTDSTINSNVSHIQIHNKAYLVDKESWNDIEDKELIMTWLKKQPEIKSFTERMLITGMGSSAQGAFGITVNGIDPEIEQHVTDIHEKIKEGSYFEVTHKNPVVIGQKLAEKLKVKLRSKVILTFQGADGNLTAGAFRVAGIYKSSNSMFDQTQVYVRTNDLARVYGKTRIHEIAMLVNEIEQSKTVSDRFNEHFTEDKAQYWGELAPELGYANDVMSQTLYVFVMIIMLSMAFGIVNSMLMAVLERRHELGMLMCVGMSKMKVFAMIVWETIFIALIGGPVGLLAAVFNIHYLSNKGIDLSIVGQGLESLGIDTIVYPILSFDYYLNVTLMIIITAIISALYPAYKAVKYNPAEAIRSL